MSRIVVSFPELLARAQAVLGPQGRQLVVGYDGAAPIVFDVTMLEGSKVKRIPDFIHFCRRLNVMEPFEFGGGPEFS